MNEKYKKYHINKGDTLDDIIRKLEIEKVKLIYDHNLLSNDNIDNYIFGDTLPKNLKYILLPLSYNKDIPISKIKYSDKNVSKTNGKTYKKYGVTQQFIINGELRNTLNYELEITENIEDHFWRSTINKNTVYLNNTDSFLIIENLYNRIDNCLYPLEINVNKDGSFKNIINEKEIHQRWKKMLPQLQDYYKGQVSDEIFSKSEKIFSDVQKYGNKLFNSIFFKVWYAPIYRYYPEEEPLVYEDHFPLFPQHKGVKFKITQSSDLEVCENNKFNIHITGSCIDNRIEQELWNAPSHVFINRKNKNKVFGNINLLYKINEIDKRIFSIVGFIELNGENYQKRIEIKIFEI